MNKSKRREQRKTRIRAKIRGTKQRPRLSVFRSSKYIYAQLIDDEKGATLLASSEGKLKNVKGMTKTQRARLLGKFLAELAKKEKISQVVFDRSGYQYHGRVKALAEGAREGGLKI